MADYTLYTDPSVAGERFDAQTASMVTDPASATQAALNGAYATRLISLSDYLTPGQAMPNDGATDASTLINTAMNDLLSKANGAQPYGQVVYMLDVGPGLFRLDSSILPGGATPASQNAHVGIKGAGRRRTIFLPHGATSAIEFKAVDADNPAAVDCHFEDFTIDMVNATLGSGGASRKGFVGRGWFDCTWTNVHVLRSPATAFGADFPVRCTFDSCAVTTTGLGVDGELDMSGGVIVAAQYHSGFGLGFGVFDDESVTFINCAATDCYRGGFFFEAFEASSGQTKRTAVIKMIGCRSWNNRIGGRERGRVGPVCAQLRDHRQHRRGLLRRRQHGHILYRVAQHDTRQLPDSPQRLRHLLHRGCDHDTPPVPVPPRRARRLPHPQLPHRRQHPRRHGR